ncbi:hypothetical protein KAJ89_05920 [Candidatus Parcubacteria bacterium]|nr:hypothetical protein [Candidatus Parcubacteria bacterium]
MLNFNKVICAVAVLAIFVFLPFVTNATSAVQDAQTGLNKSAAVGYDGATNPSGAAGPTSVADNLPTAIGQIVGAVLAFIGVLFLGLMVYGGFTWMTARGNDQNVEKAKDLIQAAVIGLVIILAAYAITDYIGKAMISTGGG